MQAEKQRTELTPTEKRERRYQRCLNPEFSFSDPGTEKKYQERVLRFNNGYRVEKPDGVPVAFPRTKLARLY